MSTKVRKWGNSLAVRIPKVVAEEAGVYEESEVEMNSVDGKIVISPSLTRKYSLKKLLSNVRKEKLHGETDTGEAVGREEW